MVSEQEREQADKLKKRKGVWKVAYTNINGIISSLRNLNVYLVKKAPDIMGLAEIKLYEELEEVKNIGQNMYNVWKRSRPNKKGGGVMLMVKKSFKVVEIEYGDGSAEVLKMKVENRLGNRRQFIMTYVPPKTNAWSNDEYEEMIKTQKIA